MSSSLESECKENTTFEVRLRELERVFRVIVILLLARGSLKIIDDIYQLILVNLDGRLILINVVASLCLGLYNPRRILTRLVVLISEADALLKSYLELDLS